jgi:hypothetical protein
MSNVIIIIKITIPNKESFPEMPIGTVGAWIYSLYSYMLLEIARGKKRSQQGAGI